MGLTRTPRPAIAPIDPHPSLSQPGQLIAVRNAVQASLSKPIIRGEKN